MMMVHSHGDQEMRKRGPAILTSLSKTMPQQDFSHKALSHEDVTLPLSNCLQAVHIFSTWAFGVCLKYKPYLFLVSTHLTVQHAFSFSQSVSKVNCPNTDQKFKSKVSSKV